MNDEKLNVKFKSEYSRYSNCTCSCCHGTASVLKVMIPKTLYHDEKALSTKYGELWVCDDCKNKLIAALMSESDQPSNPPQMR